MHQKILKYHGFYKNKKQHNYFQQIFLLIIHFWFNKYSLGDHKKLHSFHKLLKDIYSHYQKFILALKGIDLHIFVRKN